eukprot:3645778-Prymnesium_polylepis.1
MHFLVNSIRQDIQNELVAELYREHEFDEMLQEAEDAVSASREPHGASRVVVPRESLCLEIVVPHMAIRPPAAVPPPAAT